MNENLLKKIKKNLYEVDGLISTPSFQNILNKFIIDTDNFVKIVNLYLSKFSLLKDVEDEELLELLNEHLRFVIEHINSIHSNSSKIEACLHFMKRHKTTFFKDKNENTLSNIYLPKKNKIEFLNNISIIAFFSIQRIKLHNLKDKKEIYIVGENGDGKTLLLQAIAVALKGTQEDGLKEFREIEDTFNIDIENKENIQNNFFAYGALRNNSCQLKEDTTGYLSLFSEEYDLKSPTKWLQYLDYSEQKENNNVISVIQAKALLNHLLNSDITININPKKVTFREKGSEVSFEQLSAGYKGVITIICDLIARLSEKQQVDSIVDFQGVVLIDEVELHLHPKWKYNFMTKLREIFPLIQFIVTTHSPTVILGASKEAVFYKIYKDNGKVSISNQIANEGYTNNSLVSSPLFDMETITSREYEKNVSSDDYIYEKIHQQVAQKIKEDINVDEEALLKLIDEELAKI